MATFLNKLKAITQVNTELTDTQLVYYLQAGSNFVYVSIPQHLLKLYTTMSTSVTDANGLTISKSWHIMGVERNNIPAEEVDPNLRYLLDYSGSLHEATEMFPKYYIWNNKVYIKPNPTLNALGNVSYISPPTISNTTDSDNVTYSIFSNVIVNYGAALTFTSLANYYAEKAVSDVDVGMDSVDDAMDKAQKLIDDHSGVGGDTLSKSVQSYLTSEDTELAVATIQAAQEEVQRAVAAIQNTGTRNKVYSQESQVYFTKAELYFKMAEAELKGYINSKPEWIQFNAELAAKGVAR